MRSSILLAQHLRHWGQSLPLWIAREATWDFDFINERAWIENIRGQGVAYDLAGMLGQLTFTRASSATYFDSAGVLQDAANNVPRLDHDPLTGAKRGALLAGSRVGSIRNPRCEGAAAPSTRPTNWSLASSATGLTITNSNPIVEDGIECIDITVSGTASSAGSVQINFETNTAITAASGQTWTTTAFHRLMAGALPGSTNIIWVERDSGGSSVTFGTAGIEVPTASPLRQQRAASTRTLSGGESVARVTARYDINVPNGSVVSFTIRVGLPQLEQGAFASSPIRPPVGSPAAATRAADVLTAAVGDWFNTSEGTLVAAFSLLGLASGSNQYAAAIDDGSVSNQFRTLANNAGNTRSLVTRSGGSEASLLTGAAAVATPKTVVFAWAANSAAAVEGDGVMQTDASVVLPAGMTTVRFGCDAASASQLFGHLRRVSYIPRRVSDAELQALSA